MGFREGNGDTGQPRQAGLRRELLELAAIFCAGGSAHFVVLSLGHQEYGGPALVVIGSALLGGLLGYRWWRDRRGGAVEQGAEAPEALWRVRVGVADAPGGLAALTARLARIGVDIRVVHVHPGVGEAVDEFVVSGPPGITPGALRTAVSQAGGRDPVVEPAAVHHLSDTATRALSLAGSLLSAQTSLEDALASMSGAHRATWHPSSPGGPGRDEWAGSTMCLAVAGGGVVVLERDGLPFTPTEFARCRALVRLALAAAPDTHAARHADTSVG